MRTLTSEDINLAHILKLIEQQLGGNFLLILSPDGNGNVVIPTQQEEAPHTNILFDQISSVISPSGHKH